MLLDVPLDLRMVIAVIITGACIVLPIACLTTDECHYDNWRRCRIIKITSLVNVAKDRHYKNKRGCCVNLPDGAFVGVVAPMASVTNI